MPTYGKSGGIWRTFSPPYGKSGGIWRTFQFLYAKASGVWRTIFVNATPPTFVNATEQSGLHDHLTSGTMDVSVPSGYSSGDILIVQLSFEDGSANLAKPSGWTTLWDVNVHSNLRSACYYRIASSSEPASYSWDESSITADWGAVMSCYSGVSASPIDASNRTTTSFTSSPSSPSVTTTTAQTRVLRLASSNFREVTGAPSGTTLRADEDTRDVKEALADETQSAAGSTGSATWSTSGGTTWSVATIALAPA